MKVYTSEALAALADGSAIVTGAIAIMADPPIRVWGGHGILTMGEDEDAVDFTGLAARELIKSSTGALGGAAQGLSLSLSGIDPAVLALLDADEVMSAPVIVWRLVFAGDGQTLLDARIYERGRLDTLASDATVGGTAALVAALESAARGLGRSGSRMRSDADQRLVNPADGFFKNVSYAAEKMLYWGGMRPTRAGSGVGGGEMPRGGAGGGGGVGDYDPRNVSPW